MQVFIIYFQMLPRAAQNNAVELMQPADLSLLPPRLEIEYERKGKILKNVLIEK